MKNYMKKSCIMSSLICIITLFSYIYASCVLGANKMGGENEYIVTINGIEMYSGAAIELLERIIREEKEIVNIVDKNMGRTLDVTEEILKPEVKMWQEYRSYSKRRKHV